MGQKVVVISGRMPMYAGTPIEGPGQVIELTFQRNDDLLLRHRYVRPIAKSEDIWTCDACGSRFLGDVTGGPAVRHLAAARHDADVIATDEPQVKARARKSKAASADADPDGPAQFPLETEGASPPTKLEGERATVKMR